VKALCFWRAGRSVGVIRDRFCDDRGSSRGPNAFIIFGGLGEKVVFCFLLSAMLSYGWVIRPHGGIFGEFWWSQIVADLG